MPINSSYSSVSPLDPKSYEPTSQVASEKKGVSGNRIVRPLKSVLSSIASRIHSFQSSKHAKFSKGEGARYNGIEYHVVRKGMLEGEDRSVRYDIQRVKKSGEVKTHGIFSKNEKGDLTVEGFTKDMQDIANTLVNAVKEGSIPRKDGLLYLKQLQTDLNGMSKDLTIGKDIKQDIKLINELKKLLTAEIKTLETQTSNKSPSLGNRSVAQSTIPIQNYNLQEAPGNGIKLLKNPKDTTHQTFELGAGKHGYTLLLRVPLSRQQVPEGTYSVEYTPGTAPSKPGVNVRVTAEKIEEDSVETLDEIITIHRPVGDKQPQPLNDPQAGPKVSDDRDKNVVGDSDRKSFTTTVTGSPVTDLRPDSLKEQESSKNGNK